LGDPGDFISFPLHLRPLPRWAGAPQVMRALQFVSGVSDVRYQPLQSYIRAARSVLRRVEYSPQLWSSRRSRLFAVVLRRSGVWGELGSLEGVGEEGRGAVASLEQRGAFRACRFYEKFARHRI